MNWKGSGRKRLWNNRRYYRDSCIRGLRKTTEHLSQSSRVQVQRFEWSVTATSTRSVVTLSGDQQHKALSHVRPCRVSCQTHGVTTVWQGTRFNLRGKPWRLTHGTGSFLRSRQFRSYSSRTSLHPMEPEGSLPCSQEPSTGPYPEPDRVSPYQPILSNIHFNIIHPPTSCWSS
jgi:hypothetical protein